MKRINKILLVLTTVCFLAPQNLWSQELEKKIAIVEKGLKSDKAFAQKVKFLVAFLKWADKELLTQHTKLKDDDFNAMIQYVNILKAVQPKGLSLGECPKVSEKIKIADSNPLSDQTSAEALRVLDWMKQLCGSSR